MKQTKKGIHFWIPFHFAVLFDCVGKRVRDVDDNVRDLQLFLPSAIDGVIADIRAEDIAGDRRGSIAVTVLIDGGDDALGKIILILESAVDRDREHLFGIPALADLMDVIQISVIVFG